MSDTSQYALDFNIVLCVASVVISSAFGVWHINRRNFYDSTKCWMVTILTFHTMPFLVWRTHHDQLVGSGIPEQVCLFCWLMLATGLRWKHATSPYSLSISLLEIVAAIMPLSTRILKACVALNLLILPVFWTGVTLSSFSAKFSFVPLDRHMRLGIRHMLRSSEAHDSLFANIILHGLQQYCAARALLHPATSAGLHDVMAAFTFYWTAVSAFAASVGCGLPYPIPAAAGLGVGAVYWTVILMMG
eukprot:TRINITY_DN18582_c0_g1_i1.p1 TRINITY_DN18582_c0_g1~~TRINITY_DN18582_c0_g1_i1.p1  ORF type:complete len:246 (-),score=28.56 TRINITY_DN18582_c0_g1_i1:105-842(-)